jgi:signal transduction histidine kinase
VSQEKAKEELANIINYIESTLSQTQRQVKSLSPTASLRLDITKALRFLKLVLTASKKRKRALKSSFDFDGF